jgi:hypothetical protein
MIPRHATVIICDELLFSITGKINLLGSYTGDITIPTDPTQVGQLLFYFLVETDVQDPYKSLTFQVTLPQANPVTQIVPVVPQIQILSGRPRYTVRLPLLIPQPLLHPGRIEAKVIHESGELIAGTPWIVLAGQQHPPVPS